MNILSSIYRIFRSYALATTVLVLLTVVTLLGTLDQVNLGLFGAVQKYFHSWFIKSDILQDTRFPVPIFLPGGMLLMTVLFINMTLGALVHVRKRWRGVPNLITHLGIVFLFISSFVTFVAKNDGYVALFPGQSTDLVSDYKRWQLEVLEFDQNNRAFRSHVIPWEELIAAGAGKREFYSDKLGITLEVDHFFRNAMPIPSAAPVARQYEGVTAGEIKLAAMKKDLKEEKNFPGCLVRVYQGVGTEKALLAEKIISSYSATFLPGQRPMAAGFELNGKPHGLLLAKTSWKMPYRIRLDQFIFDKHPGTENARNYESRITRIESPGSPGEKVAIRMNEPMRHGGFVVFQESFGQKSSGEYYSQFAVSDNPSDQWPTWALVVISIGLLLQFVWKLAESLRRSRSKMEASPAGGTPEKGRAKTLTRKRAKLA